MTSEERKELYARLRERLYLDIAKLDEEVSMMPVLVQEAAELATAMENEEVAAKMALGVIRAEAAARLREIPLDGGKARPETRVESELILDEQVQLAQAELAAVQMETARCKALYNSMRDKRGMVSNACDMSISIWHTSASYTGSRTKVRQEENKA